MKVAILHTFSEKKGLINKDVSGGFGTVSNFGTGFAASLLSKFKKKAISYPPLLLAYAAAIFKQKGINVLSYINEVPNADLVIMHSSIVDYLNENVWIKKIKRETNSKVGVIGPFASVRPDLYLEAADFVIKGEPEQVLINLDLSKIPTGIVESPAVECLDALPFPAWEVFNYDKFVYKPYFFSFIKKNFFPVLSSRGCPMPCQYYCPYPVAMGNKWRARSTINVVDEIEYLVKNFNAGEILFRDPYYTLDPSRTKNIADEIINRRLKISYVCETHLDSLTEELIDLLYDSGLRALKVGIESVEQEVLKTSKRMSLNLKRQERLLKYCEKKKISVTAFYILGNIKDTKESIYKTLKFAKKLNTVGAQFVVMTPYPGTPFYEDMKQKIVDHNFEHYDIHTLVFRHDNFTSEELIDIKNYCYNSYYIRPRWTLKMIKEKLL